MLKNILTSPAAKLIMAAFGAPITVSEIVIKSITAICSSLLLLSAVIPLVFKFGAEKGRLLILASAVILTGLLSFIQMPNIGALSGVMSPVILLTAAAIAVTVSIGISERVYKSR